MFTQLEELSSTERHIHIRAWVGDLGELDAETGLPWRGYQFVALLSFKDGVGELKGAQTVPPGAGAAIRRIARLYGLTYAYLVRWDPVTKTKVHVPIYRAPPQP